ncbi:hypothetical protein F2Q68_00038728 [Brassica cretica]|uniref:Uncharacterized protein n=1 Tax=Brassica cretica TaxID=69181 RepID=A0A8S9MMC2_BRACR|nr:hypothetical protein F2Q68_00038728 [Brassica cretica]
MSKQNGEESRLSKGNGNASKSATDKAQVWQSNHAQATYTARSLCSDRAQAKLGRYVATKHAVESRLSKGNGHTSKSATDKAQVWQSDYALAKLGRYILPYEKLCGGNTRHRTRAPKGSLRSDQTRVPLGRYVVTNLEPKLGRYVATERSFRSVAT